MSYSVNPLPCDYGSDQYCSDIIKKIYLRYIILRSRGSQSRGLFRIKIVTVFNIFIKLNNIIFQYLKPRHKLL